MEFNLYVMFIVVAFIGSTNGYNNSPLKETVKMNNEQNTEVPDKQHTTTDLVVDKDTGNHKIYRQVEEQKQYLLTEFKVEIRRKKIQSLQKIYDRVSKFNMKDSATNTERINETISLKQDKFNKRQTDHEQIPSDYKDNEFKKVIDAIHDKIKLDKRSFDVIASLTQSSKTNLRPKIRYHSVKSTDYKQNLKHLTDKNVAHFAQDRVIRQAGAPCYGYGSCDLNNESSFPSCYCDSKCSAFNDCCYDFQNKSVSRSTAHIKNFDFMTCEIVTMPHNTLNFGYHMVTDCPYSNVQEDIARKCRQNSDLNIPVTEEDGTTYRNVYCAMCHGIQQYTYWFLAFKLEFCTVEFSSINNVSIDKRIELLNKNGCELIYVPPYVFSNQMSVKPRQCITEVDEVKEFIIQQPEKCLTYYNPIYIAVNNKILYLPNYMCLREDKKDLYYISCFLPTRNPYNSLFISKGGFIAPITVLFQFNNDRETALHDGNCIASENGILGNCIKTTCINQKTESCVTDSVINAPLNFDVILVSDGIVEPEFFQRTMAFYFMLLPRDRYDLFIQGRTKFYGGDFRCSREPEKECCTSSLKLDFIVGRFITLQDLDTLKSAILKIDYLYNETGFDMSDCQIASTRQTCITNEDTSQEPAYEISIFSERHIKDVINMNSFNASILSVPQSINLQVQVIFDQNSTLRSVHSLTMVKVLQLSISYIILTNTRESTIATTLTYTIQAVISYVTMGLSTLFLLATLFIYIYFHLYKTLAGHACINVIITLILAYFLFMSGIGATFNNELCTIIGASLHYIWLCVFTWISIYTFLVAKTLVNVNKSLTYVLALKKRHVYIFGYCFPLLITLTSILTTYFEISNFDVGYSKDVCFPTSYPANLMFFSAPVLVSLVANICILGVAVKELNKITVSGLHVSSGTTLGYVIPFIKLCVISGFFWIFGILSQALDNEILAYIFIFGSGLHGLMISICFCTSAIVKAKIHEKYLSKDIIPNVSKAFEHHTEALREEIELGKM